MAKKIVL